MDQTHKTYLREVTGDNMRTRKLDIQTDIARVFTRLIGMEKRIVVTLNWRNLEEAEYNKCLMVTTQGGHNSSISQGPSEWLLL
jgi:hypothetical protein